MIILMHVIGIANMLYFIGQHSIINGLAALGIAYAITRHKKRNT